MYKQKFGKSQIFNTSNPCWPLCLNTLYRHAPIDPHISHHAWASGSMYMMLCLSFSNPVGSVIQSWLSFRKWMTAVIPSCLSFRKWVDDFDKVGRKHPYMAVCPALQPIVRDFFHQHYLVTNLYEQTISHWLINYISIFCTEFPYYFCIIFTRCVFLCSGTLKS